MLLVTGFSLIFKSVLSMKTPGNRWIIFVLAIA
jgi:hypothetical protein